MRSGHHTSAVELFIDYWNGIGSYLTLPLSRRTLFASQLPKVVLDFQALMDDSLRPADYRRIAAPACLIARRESPLCTHAILSILADSLAHRETHEVDAGHHMAPLTHPELVNPLIDDFIRSIDVQDRQSLN